MYPGIRWARLEDKGQTSMLITLRRLHQALQQCISCYDLDVGLIYSLQKMLMCNSNDYIEIGCGINRN